MNNLDDFLDLFKKQIKIRKGTRWGVFCTNSQNYPVGRNVIIRDFKEPNKLYFFTHEKSQKVEQVTKSPSASLCWYHHGNSTQLQFFGDTVVASQETIEHYKSKVKNFRDYAGPRPGSKLGQFSDEGIYFTVLEMSIAKITALKIGRESHKKYDFVFKDGNYTQVSLVP
jgi:uncharacterized pyridoxamine 5'-phosphate oxidase family protein